MPDPMPECQVMSDVSACIPSFCHLWILPLSLGSLARATLGHLPRLAVILIIETFRLGFHLSIGAANASFIVQLVTIFNLSWINQFQDSKVIQVSQAFACLHYLLYLPELTLVSSWR